MKIQTLLDSQIRMLRDASFKNSQQITLGQLISLMDAVNPSPDCWVEFDFPGQAPDGFCSWRGAYCELAIQHSEKDCAEVQLSDFLPELKSCVGKEFDGYKGGEYTMSESTPVWVANYGLSGNTGVVGIKVHGDDKAYGVTILTAYCEY